MESVESVSEIASLFEKLRAQVAQFAVSEDADIRALGKSKRGLNYCESELRKLADVLKECSGQVNAALDRVARELAAITNTSVAIEMNGKSAKISDIPSGDFESRSDNIIPSNGWVNVAKKRGKNVPTSTTPILKPLPVAQYEDVQIVPGYSRKCIHIDNRQEALKYLGRICVLQNGLTVVAIEDYVIPLWVPDRQADGLPPYKVIDHNDPTSVVDPTRNKFYVDPVLNPASMDTGNFLLQTHIRPISTPVNSTNYCVRVGGAKTIIADLALCSQAQLAYARRYYLSGIMTAIMIADTERKLPKPQQREV